MLEIRLVKYAFNKPYERKINGSYQFQQEHPSDSFFEQLHRDRYNSVKPLLMMTSKKVVNSQLACIITLFMTDEPVDILFDLRKKATCILEHFIETYTSDLMILMPQFRLLLREDIDNVSVQKFMYEEAFERFL